MYTHEQVVDTIEIRLNKSEREIIMIRFGISREQVREIEKKALTYIREHC
ncbi:hypothetical protein [Desulfitobacterium sp.]|nr:hypothetical protein [Desulfitobacterium sp.]MEA4901742.1 hypothetical protein [Desulfitobacterium sp.]